MQPVDRSANAPMRYVLDSCPEAVRSTLAQARLDLAQQGSSAEALGPCELVLAEALNNIVEHAYGEQPGGTIQVQLCLDAESLHVQIEDSGFEMPDGALPNGELSSLDVETDDLPEGGFGWFLIRSMTDHLRYRRKDGVNYLNFSVPMLLE